MRSISKLIALGFAVVAFVAAGYAQEVVREQAPVLMKEVMPVYTREAREAGIQGNVYLSVVVLKEGTVGDVDVTESLDKKYGLDEQAVKAVKQWTFKPGTKDGTPVDVRVDIQMSFTLK
jgi:periplasmic protein TonB